MLDNDILPNVNNVQKLLQIIDPIAIIIYDTTDNISYFGIELNCILK